MFNNSDIKFKYTWRPYQKKVLDDIQEHLKDKKIHIVAAPGSGKTVLGLEIARSLKNAVLILSPTLTIKYQWIDRFVNLFMPEGSAIPSWVSQNIYDLKYFNSVTYQGLHYAYKKQKMRNVKDEDTDDDEFFKENNNENVEIETYSLVEEIKKQKIKTIILDEAHHLKTQWWESLTKVLEELEDITLIALTATPPYDVEYSQFKKYMDLCGPIDAEISVPELVAVDNLCPHQDYVYFNYPTKQEQKILEEYEGKVNAFFDGIKKNSSFIEAIENHPYILATNKHQEEILEDPQYYSSMLIYLNSVKPFQDKEKVKVLGHTDKVPNLDFRWLEILLQKCIFADRENYANYEDTIKNIEEDMNKIGIIEKKKVMLVNNKNLQNYIINSMGKLDSINAIVKSETENLGKDLRMVILTDYIRKEYLTEEDIEITKLGVFPIFISVLKQNANAQIAILTGNLFAIPVIKKELLIKECVNLEIPENKLTFQELPISKDYIIVKTVENFKNLLMKAIAKLFSNGDINIIIGTKSLLGEGWDEPSINSLILASFVGSYMLSNQMRGRAIRTNDNPRKTANIWHLVCITDSDDSIENQDYEMLKRRFDCFVGIGYNEDVIENGIQRVDIIPENLNDLNFEQYKEEVTKSSSQRNEMYDKWKRLSNQFGKNNIKVVQNIQIEKEELNHKFKIINRKQLFKIIKLVIVSIILICLLSSIESKNVVVSFAKVTTAITLSILFAIRLVPIIIRLIKNVPIKLIREIAQITLKCLCQTKQIKTDYNKITIVSVETVKKQQDNLECHIIGVTPYENNIFVKSMKEIFSRVENQRYIIVKETLKRTEAVTYYNVPELLAQKKEDALEFFWLWDKKIEGSELIYTHTEKGREILLRARRDSFDYNDKVFEKQKVISNWK